MLHPSPVPSDWSSKDWDGDKAKAREQKSLIDFMLLEKQTQDTRQTRERLNKWLRKLDVRTG